MDTDLFIAGAAGTNKAMKSVAASKKMVWYVYIPGKTALDALWALGVGTAAPSKVLEEFVAHAGEQKKKVFAGKMPRVTIGGATTRVFQPKGKAPPAATLFRDATVMGMKAGAAAQIPKIAAPVSVKKLLKDLGWAGLTSKYSAQPEVLAAAFNFRKIFVDQLLASMRADHKTLIWKSVGSMSLTSDYDITLTIPGDPVGAIGVVQKFNKKVAALFAAQPGTVFDTNLYVRDFAKVNAKGRGSVAGVKDSAMPSKPKALKKMLEAGQDVAALLKQRRFMDQGDFFLLMEETVGQIESRYKSAYGDPMPKDRQTELDKLTQATLQQFETADAQFQLNQSRLRKAEGMPKEVQAKVEAFLNPEGLEEKAELRHEMAQMVDAEPDPTERAKLQKELDKLTHELEQIPAYELVPLRKLLTDARAELKKLEAAPVPTDATAKQAHLDALKKLRAEVLRLEGELANREADLLREDGGDLTLEISNELYLKSMTEAAQIEQKLTIKTKTLELIELRTELAATPADDVASVLRLDIEQHIADLTQLGAAPNLDALPDRATLQSEVDSTKAVLRDKISEGAFFASEAYQTEGAVEHVVQGMQAGGRLDGVSTWQLLESFNENVGDFMKDMKHYETVDDLHIVAKGFYKSSKYLHRLLDTIKEIKAKFGVADVLPFEKRLLGDAEKVKKQLEDTVLAVRKGAKEFVSGDGEDVSPADLEKRRDEYVLEQLDSLFQSTSLYHLANVVKSLSREVNAWVRTLEMEREAIADREEERAYFGAS